MSATKCYCIECYSSGVKEAMVDVKSILDGQLFGIPFGEGTGRHRDWKPNPKPDGIVEWDGKSEGTHFLCDECVPILRKDTEEVIAECRMEGMASLCDAGRDMTGQDQEQFLGWPRG